MENQVLGYQSPLYGRRIAQYKILPFNYIESSVMLPGFINEEKIVLYSITGGIPEYLSRINKIFYNCRTIQLQLRAPLETRINTNKMIKMRLIT